MSFIVKPENAPELEAPIVNGAFWPEIDPAIVRVALRIDTTITPERLRDALIEAIASANAELKGWRAAQQLAGHASLAAVPADEIDGISVYQHRYQRAVGCLAKATLTERYRDIDSTAAGNKKADQLENPIDDLRRDARWAISDILGTGRTVVELI